MWSSLPLLESILANWIPLSPSSRGLITLPQSSHPTHDPPYTLDPLNTGSPQEAYMLSAPHQLHCLSTIMHSYGKLWNGADETHMAEHIAHCFDYLRQGILCAGDVTVEGNASWRFPDRKVEPPWGAEHMCRDWEGVREWADEKGVWEFPDGLGIL
ncbi:hypothetical protein M409DRAFT_23243 [Zasmidium cellare ATCC 36951]|uniref:Uncharacterized protein n=1 Tax=Zasmidium cellare ATCC 36951 TaxID=1080233 RepID=A0A6A6CLL2_ZASCE|nr:uncharacterized protein M409DRAFT_23243 [Zasmidium cellare ATCC 36951]KAF2166609.1 hypothetical protein M409DRAFT_23243 [Zasmidium cellare ATCC 36951]